MGAMLARATGASAAPRVFTSAPNAEAAVQAAKKAAFPPMPSVPGGGTVRPPQAMESEMHANRGIAEMLAKSNILTHEAPAASSVAASSEDDAGPSGLEVEDLMKALVLHAQDPQQWTPEALAVKFEVEDAATLAVALQHVRPYRIVDDSNGRTVGVPIGLEEDADDGDGMENFR
jgi:hypothetical protein